MIMTDVAAKIVALGLCTAVGTDLFKGQMPDAPDVCVGVHAYGGAAPDDVTGCEYPKFQLQVRSTSPELAYAKAYALMEGLHSLRSVTLGTTLYHCITADSSPIPIGEDARGRWTYTVNFSVYKEMD